MKHLQFLCKTWNRNSLWHPWANQ